MNKNEKTAFAPELRFPEFRSTGEWKTCTLSELASRITIRNQANSVKRVLTNSAIDGVIDQSDYFDREVANQNNLENYFVINEGDYVYNPRISATAPVGPISKNKVGKGVVSPLYTVFRFENHNNDFYEQYFRTNLWHSYLKNVSNTGARHDRMSISNDSFMKMPLPYHLEKEQQKIADCLSSFDNLITAENKKLVALEAHKKGLMQKLFPAEGETVPEIRLKGFTNTWERRKLGEIYNFKYGQYNNNPSNGGKYPVYGANGIIGGYTDFNAEDSVVIGHMGAYAGEVLWAEGKHFVTYNGTMAYPKTSEFDTIYGYYMLQHLQISKVCTGSGQPFLAYDVLNKIDCVITNNHKEQTVIGNLFRNLDEFIMSQTKKIETLKLHKKGLLQGLFPSAQEVNG